MIAAGRAIALVDPILEKMTAAAVVFRPLAGRGVFAEKGGIYRGADASAILAPFLHEVRATPRERTSSAAVPRKSKKGPRRGERHSPVEGDRRAR
jgi:hypothetical protein